MIELLETAHPTARKEHKCNYCRGTILYGERYEKTSLKNEGTLYTWKAHLKCSDIASKLKMFDHADEGVTADFFQEAVDEEYYTIIGDQYDNGRKFQERLDFVIKHHERISQP